MRGQANDSSALATGSPFLLQLVLEGEAVARPTFSRDVPVCCDRAVYKHPLTRTAPALPRQSQSLSS